MEDQPKDSKQKLSIGDLKSFQEMIEAKHQGLVDK